MSQKIAIKGTNDKGDIEQVFLPDIHEFNTLSQNLKLQIHDSIRLLLENGYSYGRILQESGVHEAFLQRVFQEFNLQDKYSTDESVKIQDILEKTSTSIKNTKQNMTDKQKTGYTNMSISENRCTKISNRNIQVEMRISSLKIQMELRNIANLMNDSVIKEQLKDDMIRKNLIHEKEYILELIQTAFSNLSQEVSTSNATERKMHNDSSTMNLDYSKNAKCIKDCYDPKIINDDEQFQKEVNSLPSKEVCYTHLDVLRNC